MIDSQLLGIDAISMRDGPFAPSLQEPLLALGRLYRRDRQYDKALESAARARHISRVNSGLESPEQFAAIEMTIDTLLELQNYQQAAKEQQALVTLYGSRYGADAPELVPVLKTLGDMYFDAFERWRHDLPGRNMLVPEYGSDTGFVDPGQMQPIDIAFACLRKAQQSYLKSIHILTGKHDYTNPELADLERDLITTLFLQAHRRELDRDRVFFIGEQHRSNTRGMSQLELFDEKRPYYRGGEEAFHRLLYYMQQDPSASPAQIAEVMLQLGDWHRLFGWNQRSDRIYQQADTFMRAHEPDDTAIARLMQPEVPIQLPAFLPAPNSRGNVQVSDQVSDTGGYIDVEFTVDKNGHARGVEVLARSSNATDAIESRLLRVLRNAPFRKQFVTGQAEKTQPVTVRYLFASY